MRLGVLLLLVAATALADRPQRRARGPRATPAKRTALPEVAPTPLRAVPVASPVGSEPLPPLVALAPAPPAELAVQAVPFEIGEEGRLTVAVTHPFTRADARARVTQLLAYWHDRFGVQSEWHGFRVFLSGTVMGIDLKALFLVGEQQVVALATDPGTLLRSSAETYVERKLRKYLSPTYDEP